MVGSSKRAPSWADASDRRVRVADAEDHLRPPKTDELPALAVEETLVELLKGHGVGGESP